MKLTQVETIEKRNPYNKNQSILDEFLRMNTPYALAEDGDRKAKHIQSSLYQSIKRFGFANMIACVTRNNKVYLVNKTLVKDEDEQ